MAALGQVSKSSRDQSSLLEEIPLSSADQAVQQVALPLIHPDRCDDPCHDLRIKKSEKRDITLEELKTACAAASVQGDKCSLSFVLSFGALSNDREIIRFVFEKIYSSSLLSQGSDAHANPLLIFCNNPLKAEEGIDIIQKYAAEGDFSAMVHLVNYHHCLDRAHETEETQNAVKKVADYFLDETNFSKLFMLPTQLLTKALDYCLMVSERDAGYFDGRRPVHAGWLKSCCRTQGGKVSTLIGYCLEFGIGLEKDFSKASLHYDEGMGVNNGVAYERLAHYWLEKEEKYRAIGCFEKAANQNLGSAQFSLAKIFYEDGLKRREAFYWMEKAASQGIPEAIRLLAVMREEGFSVDKSKHENRASG